MKSIIVAYDRNRGIGASNDLLWTRDLPADLRHFKELTTGHTIIMGRKTYDSIGRALPNRQNIVMSGLPITDEGIVWANRIQDAYELASDKDIFVIGGGQIYNQALVDMDTIYATEVDATFDNADVFFPEIKPDLWIEKSREHHEADERNKYNYDFVVYERKK